MYTCCDFHVSTFLTVILLQELLKYSFGFVATRCVQRSFDDIIQSFRTKTKRLCLNHRSDSHLFFTSKLFSSSCQHQKSSQDILKIEHAVFPPTHRHVFRVAESIVKVLNLGNFQIYWTQVSVCVSSRHHSGIFNKDQICESFDSRKNKSH